MALWQSLAQSDPTGICEQDTDPFVANTAFFSAGSVDCALTWAEVLVLPTHDPDPALLKISMEQYPMWTRSSKVQTQG